MNKCIDCGKQTKGFGKRCYSCSNSGINSSNYIDGRTNKKCYCLDCGKKLSRNSYIKKIKRCRKCWKIFKKKNKKIYLCKLCKKPVSDYRHSICYKCANPGKPKCMDCNKQLKRYNAIRCKSCAQKLKIGKLAPGYIHGKAYEPYSLNWKSISESIRKKFKYRCIICNCFSKSVHHIDYNKQNNKKENLILLCKKHHAITNGNRDYWYAYFTYIMENFIYG